MDSLIRQRIIDILVNAEVKPRLEAEASQHSKWIICEGHQWLKWSSYHSVFNVTQTSLGIIFYVSSIYIIEETVDREISAKGIV